MSKTNLRQKKHIVEAIQKEPSLVQAIRLLRDWLQDNGYEGSGECKHYSIVRTTGKCMNCPTIVAAPILLGSDEVIGALRQKLGE